MAPKVFATGTTGYIGGDALVELVQAHPDWDITCSVRNSEKGAKIAKEFAHIKLVYGTLDDVDMIEEEASKADIVYHFADCDHIPSAEAIIRGLARRETSTPGWYIHTSGTLILGWKSQKDNTFGETQAKVYNDLDGVDELVNLPDGAAHRHVDKIVLAAAKNHPGRIKTAIVCPPCIWGGGRGPGNQRSVQLYKSAETMLKRQQGFMINKGKNVWHHVHVGDLAKLYLLLGEAAVAGGPPATWDDQGYYLAENGRFVWGEMLTAITQEAQKQDLLPSAAMEQLEPSAALGRYTFSIGTDSQGQALRSRTLLGWMPEKTTADMYQEIPKIVESEAKTLGLIKGHAEKVAS
ncbi:hypothetical protein LTS08_006100 [Lithohypha guttulata]|nr:hypothetical protein LTS08_006100 [Lithohypha guttulata]